MTREVLGTPAARAEGRGVDVTGGGLVPTPTAELVVVVVVVLPAGTLPTPTGVLFDGGRGGCTAHPDGDVSIHVGPRVCSHHLVEHSVDGIVVEVGIAQVQGGRIEPTHALHNRRAKARYV